MTASIPENEEQRLQALYDLKQLGKPMDQKLEALIEVVKQAFDVPMVMVNLVDSKKLYFRACIGVEGTEASRDVSFCAYTILNPEPLVVSDTLEDPRFRENPFVLEEPHIRFYVGVPLKGPRGYRIGSLCIMDTKPRQIGQELLETMRRLARIIELELNVEYRMSEDKEKRILA